MKEEPLNLDQIVGCQIRNIRSLRGRSLMDVANEIGVSYQQLQKYETGSNRLSVGRLFQIAATLDTDPAQIVSSLLSFASRNGDFRQTQTGNQISSVEGQRLTSAYFALPEETRRVMLRLMEAVVQGDQSSLAGQQSTNTLTDNS